MRVQQLGGCLLGNIEYDSIAFEQLAWRCVKGNEVLLSTDGTYDQRLHGATVLDRLGQDDGGAPSESAGNGLCEEVTEFAVESLAQSGQLDDVSIACAF